LRRFPGVVLELRTARANGYPHSTLRFPDRKRKHPHRMTRTDTILAMALTVHEDGLCGGCGQPRDRAWNADMEGHYEAHRATCQACTATHLAKEAKPLRPAETIFVTDASPEKDPDPRQMDIREG
jgi:hypothetical protein